MCRISRHTTLLLSGIASLECKVVKTANQGTGSLFISAENLANLARCSCLILCVTSLPTFVKVVEGCVIFHFAVDHKVHFSLKIKRKFNLKTASANWKRPGTPEARSAATSCATTLATRRTCRTRVGRTRRGAGVTAAHCVASAGTHLCRPWQVGRARWPPERRTLPPMPQPLHACKWHRRDPTYPQPTSCALICQSPAAPRAHAHPLRAPPFRHWRRRCAPPSSRRPHPHKLPSPSLCTPKAPRATC
jgi:hypothetical protein